MPSPKPAAARRYRSPVRAEAAEATTHRIVVATIALLGDRGPAATTYADVAAEAGVAVPTVYKHFPRHADLLVRCDAEIEGAAPAVDDAAILREPDFSRRLALLVDALYDRHAYFALWQRWRPAGGDGHDPRQEALIRGALEPGFGGKVPRPPLAVACALLGFAGWQTLSAMLPDAHAVKRTAQGALRALFAPPEAGK